MSSLSHSGVYFGYLFARLFFFRDSFEMAYSFQIFTSLSTRYLILVSQTGTREAHEWYLCEDFFCRQKWESSERSQRNWYPKTLRVPVPVRSSRSTPLSMICWRSSWYCFIVLCENCLSYCIKKLSYRPLFFGWFFIGFVFSENLLEPIDVLLFEELMPFFFKGFAFQYWWLFPVNGWEWESCEAQTLQIQKYLNHSELLRDHILYDLEIFRLIIKEIKNTNVWEFLEFCTIIQVLHSENNMKIDIRNPGRSSSTASKILADPWEPHETRTCVRGLGIIVSLVRLSISSERRVSIRESSVLGDFELLKRTKYSLRKVSNDSVCKSCNRIRFMHIDRYA